MYVSDTVFDECMVQETGRSEIELEIEALNHQPDSFNVEWADLYDQYVEGDLYNNMWVELTSI